MVVEPNPPLATSQRPLKGLSPDALPTFQRLVEVLRDELLDEAREISTEEQVTEFDLSHAYFSLSHRDSESRQRGDAQSVITQALRENRNLERCSYVMAIVLFVFGLALYVFGVAVADASVRIGALAAGSLVEVLILIPLRFIINSRRHNIAMRMLGLILNRVRDPAKVAPLLRQTFVAVVLGEVKFGARKRSG